MRRFFVDKVVMGQMQLSGAECHHMCDVLRVKVGDKIVLCPNDGTDYVYSVQSVAKKFISLNFEESVVNESETALDLTVFFALLKGDKSELVVTKLTELGVKNIVPFISKNTVKNSDKIERLVRASVEACKQCGRAKLPNVCEVIDISKISDMINNYDLTLIAYEGCGEGDDSINTLVSGNEKKVALIVGAEGGFTESEVEKITKAGGKAVTLGRRILRAETASIASAAVILNKCGEWS